ncbi:MAG: response regulator transcription factor [Actinomycetota bacterium]|nr:response regulator transcription factor [Actinomycetota bacterium]MEC7607706.1 response regulator transcription factor [Actinomycetota bacterium]MEC8118709.1 response regulator transcription factor [Actinomycetota bacterium]MEC8334808.1 response regulator transcription factor [Actinomycetota bacterium]MEC8392132.1 response regulator transcription factor [Actinomycetota bacterium]|tara:strand:+ start:71 stop:781 length:711 start_codon:yes stop_codon:yes gene_type:complete
MNQNLPKVLVVEDEKSFVEALKVGLDREGFDVKVAEDGLMALNLFRIFKPDLILLDVMLPKISGLDVCKEIRTESKVPIIMVTAKGEEIDTVVGLEVGADDYVTKPYRLREVVARMRSLLRRSNWSDETEAISEGRVITVSDIQIDIDKYEVKVRNEIVDFPLKEFELLLLLLENAGRVLTRDVLIDRVWGFDYVGDTKTLDVHIKRLRSKVEKDPSKPMSIVTVRGVGYKFVDTP